MGSHPSIPLHHYPLDASDIQSPAQALAAVQHIRALILATNDTRIAQLLTLSKTTSLTHHQSVLAATTRREVARKKERIELEKRGDYSKCFSGTADDTKNEAEAAALLKGSVEEEQDEGEYKILTPLHTATPVAALAALEERGTWMKYLNMNNCYGYVHGLTLEVRGNRPDAYIEEEQEQDATNSQTTATQKQNNTSAQLQTIEPRQIKETIDQVEEMSGKTLLLLTDGEHDETLRTYFSMHGVVCDLSPLGRTTKEKRAQKIRPKTVLEDCRQSTVKALQNGLTMGIFIGDIDGEDLPIVDKLCKKPLGGPTVFPAQLFQDSGKGMFTKFAAGSGSKLHLHRLYREADQDVSGGCIFKIKFQTIVISNCSAHTYKRQLKNCFPLENFVIVVVE